MFFYKLNKGFTLIDVLIATAIVSILSSLFLYGVTEARKKGEDGKMMAEAQQISTAIALYKNDNNGQPPLTTSWRYDPDQRKGIVHSEGDPNSDYLSTMQTLVDRGYLPEVPRSPSGASYSYGVDSNGNATFGVKLNRSRGGSAKNSCPAALSIPEATVEYPQGYSDYSFGYL